MNMTQQKLARRVLRGVGSQAYAQVLQLVVRLLEVPIFLMIWNTARYGEWLVLAAIPTYLSFADGGFATTSAREMTIKLSASDREGALCVYQSSWSLLTIIGTCGTAGLALLFYSTPIMSAFNYWKLPDVRLPLILLSIYVFLGFQTGLSYGVYCAEKRYDLGTLIGSSFLLIDLALALLGGWYLKSLLGAAVGMLTSRILMVVVYGSHLKKIAPWCRIGLEHASLAQLRTLVLPAFGSMAIPIGIGGNISGMRILVGAVLGPGIVPLFSAMRTLARSAQTPMLVVTRIVEPELAIAFGASDMLTVRMLLRRSCQFATWCSLVVTSTMAVVGVMIFRLWVHGRFPIDIPTFFLLLIASAINSVWYTALQVAYATNRMHKIALPFSLVYGLLSIIIAFILMLIFGLIGAALSLLLVELTMVGVVLPQVLRLSGETLPNLLRAMLVPPISAIPYLLRGLEIKNTAE